MSPVSSHGNKPWLFLADGRRGVNTKFQNHPAPCFPICHRTSSRIAGSPRLSSRERAAPIGPLPRIVEFSSKESGDDVLPISVACDIRSRRSCRRISAQASQQTVPSVSSSTLHSGHRPRSVGSAIRFPSKNFPTASAILPPE